MMKTNRPRLLKRPRTLLVSLGVVMVALHAASPRLPGQDEPTLYKQGVDAAKVGDYDRAIANFDQVIQLDPKNAAVYGARGLVYGIKGDNDKALADYNQAIELDPNKTAYYIARGRVYGHKGDYDKALANYSQAIQLDPKSVQAYLNRGDAYNKKGDYDPALADCNQAIQLDPRNPLAYFVRGHVYHAKDDYDKAVADYGQASHLDPKNAFYIIFRGQVYADKGDFDKALEDFNLAIQIDPKNVEAYTAIAYLLAMCPQAGLRDGKKAVEYATKACELSEWKNPVLLDTLAAAYAESGDFDNAIKWESKYLEVPNLSANDAMGGKSRLALYQAHKPYHTDMPKTSGQANSPAAMASVPAVSLVPSITTSNSAPAAAIPPPSVKQWVPPDVMPAQPNWTWTTTDGKTYQNVVVTKIEADSVTITHSLGVAHIPRFQIPPDIQKQLNYP